VRVARLTALVLATMAVSVFAQSTDKKPNILAAAFLNTFVQFKAIKLKEKAVDE
jgi:hypothetical protein